MNSSSKFVHMISLHSTPSKVFVFSVILSALLIKTGSVALSGCHGQYGNRIGTMPVGTSAATKASCSSSKSMEPEMLNWRASSIPFAFAIFVISVLAPFLASTYLLGEETEKKRAYQRMKMFESNGGNLLKEKLSRSKKSGKRMRIYTADDMRKATSNYSDTSHVMRRCNPGTFYRGTLADDSHDNNNTEVVVMKIQSVPKSQIERFVDQLIFLSQPHRNLVKLMGCCLETEFPLLVYELHGDGNCTLFDCIGDKAMGSRFSCEMRVKVAAGAAKGLAFLQSRKKSRAAWRLAFPRATSTFVHGNICSGNILLDDSFDAKVFYAVGSNPIPRDTGSSEQENYAYKDPKFISSDQLYKKSDVYSFGVFLAELLTGRKAFAPDSQGEDRNLGLVNFMSLVKENKLPAILDHQLIMSEEDHALFKEVAMVAARCLSLKVEERPSMKKVKAKLTKLTKLK